jgi:hypothetical protein
MSTSTSVLWAEACDVLRWHNRGTDTCIQTLNRLWRKSPWVKEPAALPILAEDQVRMVQEHWDLPRLVGLLHGKQRTANTPKSLTPPIILVRWASTDYLIDGRTRINHWERYQDAGPHRVLVVECAAHGT